MLIRKWTLYAALLIGLLLFALETLSLRNYVGSDFWVFNIAVERTLTDPATLYNDIRGVAGTAHSLLGFLYPPPSIAMLLPFGLWGPDIGFALLSWSALAAPVVALWIWLRLLAREGVVRTDRWQRVTLILLAVVTGPVFSCRGGQVDTLILFIIVAGTALAWQASPWLRALGGGVLAFGAWVKIYPVLILLSLLFDTRRRMAVFAGFAAGGLIVPLLAAMVFPLAVWLIYFQQMLPVMAARTIVNIDNQSIAADIIRLWLPHMQALTRYDSVVMPALLRTGVSLFGLAVIAIMHVRVRRTGASNLIVAGATMAVISLIAPLGWGHSYAYMLPLLVMVAAQAIAQRNRLWLSVAALAWLAILVPAHSQFGFLERSALLWYLAYSRYAIVTLGLLVGAFVLATPSRERPAR